MEQSWILGRNAKWKMMLNALKANKKRQVIQPLQEQTFLETHERQHDTATSATENVHGNGGKAANMKN